MDQKKLLDEANHRGLTNLETLGMTFDSTTRDQAIDILNSRGYTVALLKQGILEEADLAELIAKSLEKWFAEWLPSNELLGDEIKSFHDRLKESTVMFAGNIEFQGRWDNLNVTTDSKKDFMIFTFDENKKLITFFKQYSENKEVGLVLYEGMKGSGISNKGEKKPTYIFRKDRSLAVVGKRDPEATSYLIFAPSVVGKYVGAFNKAFESMINTKEFKELSEKEKEALKGLEGEEYRKQRKIFRNSKEYKELREKIAEKSHREYLKNLIESPAK